MEAEEVYNCTHLDFRHYVETDIFKRGALSYFLGQTSILLIMSSVLMSNKMIYPQLEDSTSFVTFFCTRCFY